MAQQCFHPLELEADVGSLCPVLEYRVGEKVPAAWSIVHEGDNDLFDKNMA